jgi:hypothetical protein
LQTLVTEVIKRSSSASISGSFSGEVLIGTMDGSNDHLGTNRDVAMTVDRVTLGLVGEFHSRWRCGRMHSGTTSGGRTMNEEEKQLIRAQMDFEHWLRIKQRISDGLCIACGGESDVKLYIHFCANCLREAGVKIEFVEPEEGQGSSSPKEGESRSSPKEATTSQVVLSDKDQDFLRFMDNLMGKVFGEEHK